MSRSTSIVAAVLAAIPLSVLLAGTATADDFRDSSMTLGPDGLILDTVTSASGTDGSAQYSREHLAVGPNGIVHTSTSANAGDNPDRTLLSPVTDLFGGLR